MKACLSELAKKIPGPASDKWPMGERFARAFAHGTMTVELYAPEGHDPQTPHEQDELYFVIRGSSEFLLENCRMNLSVGDAVFVPAGAIHRFENFSEDFATWVVFYGERGGNGFERMDA